MIRSAAGRATPWWSTPPTSTTAAASTATPAAISDGTDNLHLVERFSFFDADTLLYQFEIDNPTAFTRPWKGELTLTRSTERIYEFACHEANYSLTNMLRGYRATERKPVR